MLASSFQLSLWSEVRRDGRRRVKSAYTEPAEERDGRPCLFTSWRRFYVSFPRSCRHEDEVWPNLYLGDRAVAQNRKKLQKLGITHVLNAAHSKQGSIGDQSFYGNTCVYFGVPAEDSDRFDLSQYLKAASDFIHKGLKSKDGKVLVHCIMGMSRSATLVLAYFMLRQRLRLGEAVRLVVQKRAIYPNRNFLSLLLKMDEQLTHKRRLCPLF
uniref:Dual specificity protein phosphatase n=1 Tax=Gasterosteus aculeatus aculeatus TaxID=481459 RepID=G3NTL1_GASAC